MCIIIIMTLFNIIIVIFMKYEMNDYTLYEN